MKHSSGAPASVTHLLYATYACSVFFLLAMGALAAALILPGVIRRRAAVRRAARVFLRLAGMPLAVRCQEHLPAGQCVLVSNHASYIDGIVFMAALPTRFGFVIKREMASVPLAGLLLRRIGSQFVERFDRRRGAADARRLLRLAGSGHSLVFFPEGTFPDGPGLLRFHSGAFMIAARARCPVVPATIRGTRVTLAPGRSLPHPGRIVIEILPPLTASAQADDDRTVELRDRARAEILRALEEPDLGG